MVRRPWGHWSTLHKNDRVELRLLEIDKGGYCTLHYHRRTINVLFVISGELEMVVNGSRSTLLANESTTILPGNVHRFYARTGAVVYELNVSADSKPLDLSDSVQLEPAGHKATAYEA